MLGPGCWDESEVPGVLVVEAAHHAAASSSQSCSNCPMPVSSCLAGRSALPPLEPGDGGHRGMPTDHQG